jgi:hypothetical protein
MGGTHRVKGGTGKAEDAKLPDAGISPKQCPGKRMAEKERLTVPSNNGNQEPDPVVSYAKNGLRVQSRRLAGKYESQLGLAQSAAYRIG